MIELSDDFNDTLPLTIEANDVLLVQHPKMSSTTNKLSAQLNFHTMTAGWYSDEIDVISLHCLLLDNNAFIELKKQDQLPVNNSNEVKTCTNNMNVYTEISDDVYTLYNAENNHIHSVIAITEAEAGLLNTQPKLLAGYLDKKLHKVLNEIAKKYSLPEIF